MNNAAQVEKITNGLDDLLMGEDKYTTLIAALSIASTTAHMLGISKLEVQVILTRLYEKRERETKLVERQELPEG